MKIKKFSELNYTENLLIIVWASLFSMNCLILAVIYYRFF